MPNGLFSILIMYFSPYGTIAKPLYAAINVHRTLQFKERFFLQCQAFQFSNKLMCGSEVKEFQMQERAMKTSLVTANMQSSLAGGTRIGGVLEAKREKQGHCQRINCVPLFLTQRGSLSSNISALNSIFDPLN